MRGVSGIVDRGSTVDGLLFPAGSVRVVYGGDNKWVHARLIAAILRPHFARAFVEEPNVEQIDDGIATDTKDISHAKVYTLARKQERTGQQIELNNIFQGIQVSGFCVFVVTSLGNGELTA